MVNCLSLVSCALLSGGKLDRFSAGRPDTSVSNRGRALFVDVGVTLTDRRNRPMFRKQTFLEADNLMHVAHSLPAVVYDVRNGESDLCMYASRHARVALYTHVFDARK